jgi:Cu+-exporting ATPase
MATVTDPVCGMQVDPSLADAQMVYEGQAYSFCSAECLQKFRDNPQQDVGSKA